MTNNPTIDGVSREKFERSVLTINKHADIEKRKDGNYQNPHTQSAWWGFKEATTLNSDLFEVAALQSTIAQLQARIAELESRQLAVWYGAMPESNGKSNWTAILHRKGEPIYDGCRITLERSEYPDRVRYEADRVRYLIGELEQEPFILDYDANKHSGYAAPPAPVAVLLPERNKASQNLDLEQCGYVEGWNACLDATAALNGPAK